MSRASNAFRQSEARRPPRRVAGKLRSKRLACPTRLSPTSMLATHRFDRRTLPFSPRLQRSRWRSPLSRGPVSVTRAVRFVLSGSVHRARQRGIMRRNFLAFLLLNASAIAVAQTPSPTPGPIWIQEPSSYRLVRFGASFDEAQRTLSLRGCTKSHGEVNCGGYFRVSDVYVDEMLTFRSEEHTSELQS